MKHTFNIRLYGFLFGVSICSVLAVMPYVLHTQATAFVDLPFSIPLVVAISILQTSVLLGLVLFAGLFLAKKLKFGVSILEQWATTKIFPKEGKTIIKQSTSYGVIVAILIVMVDVFFKYIGIRLPIGETPPIWQGFLASFYGGIVEEIFFRLFFMTLLVWLGSKLFRISNPSNSQILLWSAISISAILFGIGHLPATAAISTLTTGLVIRSIVLNGIGGFVFGWLYWKRGLFSAMVAHFSADIMLHVVFVGLLKLFM